jgi:hypothetical protein
MSLIDNTYFNLDINLPARKEDNITAFIAKYEPEFLELVFGCTLAKLIAAYAPASEQRIKDIVDGKEYIINDITYTWKGLKTLNDSPIAYYVYCQVMRNRITHTSTTGETKSKRENSDNAETNMKVQQAHLRMLELIGEQCSTYIHYNNSLMHFISNFTDIYPEFNQSFFGSVNAFDL